jgi:signal transduction histidine kinase
VSVLAHTAADHDAVEDDVFGRSLLEERLARAAMELARRNEALEDFASLVAHELKTPLLAALAADDPSRSIEEALDLVDNLLEAARAEKAAAAFTSPADLLEELGADIEITSELSAMVPLPAEPLRVVLRNLVANAVAAGAHHVHVTAMRSAGTWQLFVDDDGSGLEGTGRYASGSGIGFGLCRRIAARFGGALELTPRPLGGTRAALVFDGAPR